MLSFKTLNLATWTLMALLFLAFCKKKSLYFYAIDDDAKRGDTKGVGFTAPGVWPVIILNTPAFLL
jgi:hypothetical protein